jgi:CDP-glucose 4,6-dehydratase
MAQPLPSAAFWRGRRVLLTGHTGFKGGWLALWLHRLGAIVHGFALPPEAPASAGIAPAHAQTIGDLRDPVAIGAAIQAARPSLVLHLAAQALVPRGWRDPHGTFMTNVQGTLNLLEALRGAPDLSAVLVVTSDKVYRNDDSGTPLAEDAPIGGADPYSASKAACELLLPPWAALLGVPVGAARAGNVLGGGDFGADRLVPDCVRAAIAGEPVRLRAPESTRPWQDVRDCLRGYLLHAEALARDPAAPRALNFGPPPGRAPTAGEVARRVAAAFAAPQPIAQPNTTLVEQRHLALDPGRAAAALGWRTLLDAEASLDDAVQWYGRWREGDDMRAVSAGMLDGYAARCRDIAA